MGNWGRLCAGLIATLIALAAAPSAEGSMGGTLTRAVDGDTVKVRLDFGAAETVRLIGVDAPETVKPGTPVECGGPQAAEFVSRFEGRAVTLELDETQGSRDSYGRLLAYVDIANGGDDLGYLLVEEGHAAVVVSNSKSFGRLNLYQAAEASAREQGFGAWGRCHGYGGPDTTEDRTAEEPRSTTAERHIRRYYYRLNERKYQSAWLMLAATVRKSLGSYAGWRAGYRRTLGVRVNRVDVTLIGEGRAIVRAATRARDRDVCNGRAVKQFFRTRWVISRRDGRWVSTSVSSRKVGGGRVRRTSAECRPRPRPVPKRAPAPDPVTPRGGAGCHPSYSPCVPDDRDYDCGELNGPYRVTGPDEYRLDGDSDGVGCER